VLTEKLMTGESKEKVREEFQKSIEDMSVENSFVCMFDTTGREICHPKRQKIGKILEENNSIIKSVSNIDVERNFKQAVIQSKSTGGLRELESYTEIVYLSPVKSVGWVVASHTNVIKFQKIFSSLKEKLFLIFVLVWLSSSLLIFFFLQYINANNLKKLSELNRDTGSQYFKELKAINDSLSSSTIQEPSETKRLLADKGTKLKPVFIENIALIFTQEKISYIIEHDSTKSTINTSLDELYNLFDKKIFYRASRQVILSINAIDRIQKYGNTQLKVTTNPACPVEIIVSKAKLTEFKKWAGQN
jgi:hypothetical protein